MPMNRKFKDQVRALAEERGIKYTEALREIEQNRISLAKSYGVFVSFVVEGARMYLPARLSDEFVESEGSLFESGFDDIDIYPSYADDYLFSAAEERGDNMLFAAEETGGLSNINIVDGTQVADWFSVLVIPEDGILNDISSETDPEMTPVLDGETYFRLSWAFNLFNSLLSDSGFLDESAFGSLHEAIVERNAVAS